MTQNESETVELIEESDATRSPAPRTEPVSIPSPEVEIDWEATARNTSHVRNRGDHWEVSLPFPVALASHVKRELADANHDLDKGVVETDGGKGTYRAHTETAEDAFAAIDVVADLLGYCRACGSNECTKQVAYVGANPIHQNKHPENQRPTKARRRRETPPTR